MANTPDDTIHFTESFRTAKRNVLFWGAATFLLACGTASADVAQNDTNAANSEASDSSIGVNTIFVDLDYQQGFLTVVALIVLAFMALGYRRAEKQLLARHTGFAYARSMHQTANLAQVLESDLHEIHEKVKKQKPLLENIRGAIGERIIHYRPTLDAHFGSIIQNIEILIKEEKRIFNASEISDIEEYHRRNVNLFEGFKNRWQSESDRVQELFESWPIAIQDLISTGLESIEKQKVEEGEIVEELSSIGKQLHGFAADIDTGDRNWFYWHDRAPVVCLTVLAAICGIWRLAHPQSLGSVLTYWFS